MYTCLYIHLEILGVSGQQTINYNSYNMHDSMSEKVVTADLSFIGVTHPANVNDKYISQQAQNAKFNIQYKKYLKIKLLENNIINKMLDTYSVAILSTELRVYMHGLYSVMRPA